MNLSYLPEYAENARLALSLAKKEMGHLVYTHHTLFSQKIDIHWVESLSEHEELSEKVDAFVSRFSRLQDHIGEKLIPRFAALLGESPKSLLDVLNYAEKVGWISDVQAFIKARKLRNLLVHEYMVDAELFLQSLSFADEATLMLTNVVSKIDQYADALGLVTDLKQ
ncbi:MAG: hypothetical protein PHN45_09965 [Methylococcales bacterium]|nr:hypothetical protein [Methylococcales bacterium]MDD5755063.1 hypothetical protein [Methylococcales bacterium]